MLLIPANQKNTIFTCDVRFRIIGERYKYRPVLYHLSWKNAGQYSRIVDLVSVTEAIRRSPKEAKENL